MFQEHDVEGATEVPVAAVVSNKSKAFTALKVVGVISALALVGIAVDSNIGTNQLGRISSLYFDSKGWKWGGNGGGGFDFQCPAGQHVTRIYGGAGSWMDSFGVQCSDGSDSGRKGGGGGNGYEYKCDDGFRYIAVNYDTLVTKLMLKSECQGDISVGSSSDKGYGAYDCPWGQRISGIYGASGGALDSIGVYCTIRYDHSPKVGGDGGGKYSDVCPPATIVTKFYGGSGLLLDSVGIVCNNGKDFGKHGGGGGGYYEKVCPSGFKSFKAEKDTGANVVKYLNLQCFDEGDIGGGWGCPGGKVIQGIYGGSSSFVDSLGVICGGI
jgi:hypothetical protein